ncbi:hypothetical protein [Nocardioides sp. TF02-7]|nr:hypothetical protein [Nocardioides sp. TF02-7]UMG94294.1 hypothetical protein MF408_09925 [Nocardioides sp. TF02-7]
MSDATTMPVASAGRLEMRWVTVVDAAGATRLEARWAENARPATVGRPAA